jgi:hypothetical protein
LVSARTGSVRLTVAEAAITISTSALRDFIPFIIYKSVDPGARWSLESNVPCCKSKGFGASKSIAIIVHERCKKGYTRGTGKCGI